MGGRRGDAARSHVPFSSRPTAAVARSGRTEGRANQAIGAYAYGGGSYALESTVSLRNRVVSGNNADGSVLGEGGVIFSDDGTLTVAASKVKGNKASTTGDDLFTVS